MTYLHGLLSDNRAGQFLKQHVLYFPSPIVPTLQDLHKLLITTNCYTDSASLRCTLYSAPHSSRHGPPQLIWWFTAQFVPRNNGNSADNKMYANSWRIVRSKFLSLSTHLVQSSSAYYFAYLVITRKICSHALRNKVEKKYIGSVRLLCWYPTMGNAILNHFQYYVRYVK